MFLRAKKELAEPLPLFSWMSLQRRMPFAMRRMHQTPLFLSLLHQGSIDDRGKREKGCKRGICYS